MAGDFRVQVRFNAGNVGVAHNVFYMQWNNIILPSDSSILDAGEAWVNRIYAPLRNIMSTAYVGQGMFIDQLNITGGVARHVGSRSVVVSGNAAVDANSGPTAMSGLARTNIPKVHGGKRFPGIIDTNVVGQLLVNAAVAAMAQAVAQWLSLPVPLTNWRPGVWSTSLSMFVPFNTSGLVTNVPGTQVTRKPFRGA